MVAETEHDQNMEEALHHTCPGSFTPCPGSYTLSRVIHLVPGHSHLVIHILSSVSLHIHTLPVRHLISFTLLVHENQVYHTTIIWLDQVFWLLFHTRVISTSSPQTLPPLHLAPAKKDTNQSILFGLFDEKRLEILPWQNFQSLQQNLKIKQLGFVPIATSFNIDSN